MPSGERIQFGPNVNFLFESHDLSCASPATISRMGMIFLNDEDMDNTALVKTWLQANNVDSGNLETWIEDYFYNALEWYQRQKGNALVKRSNVAAVRMGLSHLVGVKTKPEFLCALVRGFGGNLPLDIRGNLAKEVGYISVNMVFRMGNETVPDSTAILDTFFSHRSNRLETYQLQVDTRENARLGYQSTGKCPGPKRGRQRDRERQRETERERQREGERVTFESPLSIFGPMTLETETETERSRDSCERQRQRQRLCIEKQARYAIVYDSSITPVFTPVTLHGPGHPN
eukprot:sb/3467669/